MNALTLLDNPLFLQKQLFGPGIAQLHYYQYNYRTKNIDGPPLPGGCALVTRCDLDSDGVAAHIGADAKNPAKQQTLARVF